jgi:uncharacterized protein
MGASLAVLPVFADSSPAASEPTMNQIYEAAAGGRLDQAQQMITQVLANHPNSAKAHYVQAELFAKEGNIPLARSELGQAERLNPGLTSFSARSVQELKSQLGLSAGARAAGAGSPEFGLAARTAPRFPWGIVLILALLIGGVMLFRRRNTYGQYPAGSAPPGGYPPGYGPAPMGGGLGSGIAGGLASGLAVGAGVVAGEELAHHFLDGGRREGGGVIPAADAAELGPSNSDMGGTDFGANDPGSWDDGGGGGSDWS